MSYTVPRIIEKKTFLEESTGSNSIFEKKKTAEYTRFGKKKAIEVRNISIIYIQNDLILDVRNLRLQNTNV